MPSWSEAVERTVVFFTLGYDFLGWTIAGAALVGLICGVLGSLLYLRRLALLGDALGHAALPGVAGAFLITGHKALAPLVIGATATALLAAVTITWITRVSRTRPDAALGIALSAFFGLGAVLFSILQASPSGAQSGLNHILFGNAAAITPGEVGLLAGIAAVTLAGVTLLYRPLQLASFDPVGAQLAGVPTGVLHYGLMTLSALAIVASVQSAGVVLVAGMIITPAAAARLLTRRLHAMLAAAAGIGAVSGVLGAWLSFLMPGVSSGPAMVLCAALVYGGAFALRLRRPRAAAEAAA